MNRGNGAPSAERRELSAESRELESGGAGGQGSTGAGGKRGDGAPVSISNFAFRNSSDEPRSVRALGEVMATKPAWKRRRASENDDELLQVLAGGLAQWIGDGKRKVPAGKVGS